MFTCLWNFFDWLDQPVTSSSTGMDGKKLQNVQASSSPASGQVRIKGGGGGGGDGTSAISGVRRKSGPQGLRSPAAKRPLSAPVALQGWLYKQGSEGLMLWKKRWFVLSEYCLFYYKGPEEEKLLGSILLPSYRVTVCRPEDKVNKKFAFKAEHANMRTYHFAAETRESMNQWVNALTLASLLQDPNPRGDEASSPLDMAGPADGDRSARPSVSSISSILNQSADDSDSGFHGFQSRDDPSHTSNNNSSPNSVNTASFPNLNNNGNTNGSNNGPNEIPAQMNGWMQQSPQYGQPGPSQQYNQFQIAQPHQPHQHQTHQTHQSHQSHQSVQSHSQVLQSHSQVLQSQTLQSQTLQTHQVLQSHSQVLQSQTLQTHSQVQILQPHNQVLQNSLQSGLQTGLQNNLQNSLQTGLQNSLQTGLQSGLQNSLQTGLQNSLQTGLQNSLQNSLQTGLQTGLQTAPNSNVVQVQPMPRNYCQPVYANTKPKRYTEGTSSPDPDYRKSPVSPDIRMTSKSPMNEYERNIYGTRGSASQQQQQQQQQPQQQQQQPQATLRTDKSGLNYGLNYNQERRTPDTYGRSAKPRNNGGRGNGDYEDVYGAPQLYQRPAGPVGYTKAPAPAPIPIPVYAQQVQHQQVYNVSPQVAPVMRQARVHPPPRPHSADFLEYEANRRPDQQTLIQSDSLQNQSRRPQRPKSSLDIVNPSDTPANDNYFYSEERYAAQMRQSAVYIHQTPQHHQQQRNQSLSRATTPSMTSNRDRDVESGIGTLSENSCSGIRRGSRGDHMQHIISSQPLQRHNDLASNEALLRRSLRERSYEPAAVAAAATSREMLIHNESGTVPRRMPRDYDSSTGVSRTTGMTSHVSNHSSYGSPACHTGPRRWNEQQFARSASARLPRTRHPAAVDHEDDDDEYNDRSSNHDSRDGERKIQQREESMKRLLEWKQRMLQSPLTRKPSGSTNRGTAQNELSNYYKQQALLDLAAHEASVAEARHSRRRDESHRPHVRSKSSDGRRSVTNVSRYNSYSSDDEELGDVRRKRTRRPSHTGRSPRNFGEDRSPMTPVVVNNTHKSSVASTLCGIPPDAGYEEVNYLEGKSTSSTKSPTTKSTILTKERNSTKKENITDSLETPKKPSGILKTPSAYSNQVTRNEEGKLSTLAGYIPGETWQTKNVQWKTKDNDEEEYWEKNSETSRNVESPQRYSKTEEENNDTVNLVQSRIKSFESGPSPVRETLTMQEPLKISPPQATTEAHVSKLDSNRKPQVAPHSDTRTEVEDGADEANKKNRNKSVKDLLADFEKKSQQVRQQEDDDKRKEIKHRGVFSDTETLLYDTGSDLDQPDKSGEEDAHDREFRKFQEYQKQQELVKSHDYRHQDDRPDFLKGSQYQKSQKFPDNPKNEYYKSQECTAGQVYPKSYEYARKRELGTQEMRNQELRTLELRNQELRTLELRNQELRTLELRNQELRTLELRNQDLTQDLRNQEFQRTLEYQSQKHEKEAEPEAYYQRRQEYQKDFNEYQTEDYQRQTQNQKDYRKEDYQKQEYRKEDYQKQDYQKEDYQKQDYRKEGYKPELLEEVYQKQEYQKEDYLKLKEYQKDVYRKEDHRKEDYHKQDYRKEDYETEFLKEDYQKQEYQKEDYLKLKEYQKDVYRKEDHQKDDYLKEDYQRNDYRKEEYRKNDYRKEDYQKDDYRKEDYRKEDYRKEDYRKEEYQKEDYQTERLKPDYQKQTHQKEDYLKLKEYQTEDYQKLGDYEKEASKTQDYTGTIRRKPEDRKRRRKTSKGTEDPEGSPPCYTRLSMTESLVTHGDQFSGESENTSPIPKEDASPENHYLPMSPRKSILDPNTDDNQMPSKMMESLFATLDHEESSYVEMTQNGLARSLLAPNSKQDYGDYSAHYEFVCVTDSKMEPVYMEVNQLAEKEEEKGKKETERAELPDILTALKSDSSDADDESSKDLDSIDAPRHPRFSLSDTFRPASYYLGASRTLIAELHDSSDSELVSPPPIPTSPPPLEDLESLDTQDSLESLKKLSCGSQVSANRDSTGQGELTISSSFRDSRNSLESAGSDSAELRNPDEARHRQLKRRPVSDDVCEVLDSLDELESLGSRFDGASIDLDQYLEELQARDAFNVDLYAKDLSYNSIYGFNENMLVADKLQKTSCQDKMNLDQPFTYGTRGKTSSASSLPSMRVSDLPPSHQHSQSFTGDAHYENVTSFSPLRGSPAVRSDPAILESPEIVSGISIHSRDSSYSRPQQISPIDTRQEISTHHSRSVSQDSARYSLSPNHRSSSSQDSKTSPQISYLASTDHAPYYYSDLQTGSAAEAQPRLFHTSRLPQLNNQRGDTAINKRNDIGRMVNPIARQMPRQIQVDDIDEARRIAAELRKTSQLLAEDKAGLVDKRNFYEADTLRRVKSTDPLPDIALPDVNARNLYPQGLRDKSGSQQLEAQEFPVVTTSHRRSRSLEGLLDDVGLQNLVEERNRANRIRTESTNAESVRNTSSLPRNRNAERSSESERRIENQRFDGEDPWEQDSLWRESLRRVSLRHARSLDNLDTPPRPARTDSKSRGKITRGATYVNDSVISDDRSRVKRRSNESQSESQTSSQILEDFPPNLENGNSDQNANDDAYETLAMDRIGAGGYVWDSKNEAYRKPSTLEKHFLVEGNLPPSGSSRTATSFELDREKLRQWDLLSSACLLQEQQRTSMADSGRGLPINDRVSTGREGRESSPRTTSTITTMMTTTTSTTMTTTTSTRTLSDEHKRIPSKNDLQETTTTTTATTTTRAAGEWLLRTDGVVFRK
ncbi:uncharacterized protein LOC122510889 isoform X2 [Leptopilina heterotoma]|uniref:uncharacterized protein LOC122510889 isoform X2 n=1 Tax=Leptopilina heterotoma TaxID=63436 RepID=UPI001CAA3201|nr:uncharacterized protein LOC122510889 isoform X2 [Leptopilina heterotoma]